MRISKVLVITNAKGAFFTEKPLFFRDGEFDSTDTSFSMTQNLGIITEVICQCAKIIFKGDFSKKSFK